MRVSGLARESQRFSFGARALGPMVEDVVRGCPGGGWLLVKVCGFLFFFFFVKSMDKTILRSKLCQRVIHNKF